MHDTSVGAPKLSLFPLCYIYPICNFLNLICFSLLSHLLSIFASLCFFLIVCLQSPSLPAHVLEGPLSHQVIAIQSFSRWCWIDGQHDNNVVCRWLQWHSHSNVIIVVCSVWNVHIAGISRSDTFLRLNVCHIIGNSLFVPPEFILSQHLVIQKMHACFSGNFVPCSLAALISHSSHTSCRKSQPPSLVRAFTASLNILIRASQCLPHAWKTMVSPAGIVWVSKHASRFLLKTNHT